MVSGWLRRPPLEGERASVASGSLHLKNIDEPVRIANAVPVERDDRAGERTGSCLVEAPGCSQSREHALQDIQILRFKHADMRRVSKHVHGCLPFFASSRRHCFRVRKKPRPTMRQQQVGKIYGVAAAACIETGSERRRNGEPERPGSLPPRACTAGPKRRIFKTGRSRAFSGTSEQAR